MLNFFKKEPQPAAEPTSNIKDIAREGNDFFSDDLILLDEKLTGNLFCAEKVVVERHGMLSGNIISKTCIVNGKVSGDITSLDLLEIKATAIVMGNIQSATINIEPGAVINGYITVGEGIDALVEQWNRTKFSTDDHLTTTAKVAAEIAEVNVHVAVEQEILPEELVVKKEEKHKLSAAEAPEKTQGEENNNQRWW